MNRPTSAVTLIGLLIALGLFAAIICGLLWIGAQVLDKAETISGRYEERLTNEMKFSLVAEADPVIERLYELPDVVLLPLTNVVMTDEEFLRWSDSLVTYAVLYAQTLDGAPWLDTGERLTGDSGTVKGLLMEWVWLEGTIGATMGVRERYYRFVPEGEVVVGEEGEK